MKRIPQDVPGGGRPEVFVMPLIAAARDPTMPAAYSPVPEPAMESAGPSTRPKQWPREEAQRASKPS